MSSPSFSRPGAIDLSALAAAARGPAGPAGPTGPGGRPAGATYALDVTEAGFQADVLDRSLQVPVVLVFWAAAAPASTALKDLLVRLSGDYEGRFVLAAVDVATNPQLAASAGVRDVPLVLGVLRGQALPLFADPLPEAGVRQYLDELVKVAVTNGITGRAEPIGAPGAPPAEPPLEPPHDPRYDEAYDAIERGDLDAATAAYQKVLADAPADADAKAGLAQVGLLRRTDGVDPVAARAAAQQRPDDIDVQLTVADLDLLEGRVDEAFRRLVDTVARTAGAERDQVRTRLLELFEVVGAEDPRVPAARSALARVLF